MSGGTNPAFAHLAHQRAIFEHITNKMLESNVGTDDHPPELIENPYMAGEGAVPRDEVIYFVEQLRVSGSRIEDEMNKFEFVRRNDGTTHDRTHTDSVLQPGRQARSEPKAASGREVSGSKKRKSRRRKRRKDQGAS